MQGSFYFSCAYLVFVILRKYFIRLKRLLLSISLLLITVFTLSAQKNDALKGWGIEVNPFVGKVIKHNYIFPPQPKFIEGIDINILKQTDGSQAWQQQRNYPLVGVGLAYINYKIDSVYGRCVGIYPVWQFPIIKKKNVEWTWRAGFGVGYISRRFERNGTWDTVNNLVGSRINNLTMLSTDFRYHVNDQLSFQAGFTFSHVSNGSFRLPNLGINTYAAHIGVRYFPVSSQVDRVARNYDRLPNRWLVHARFSIGYNEFQVPDGPHYPVYLGSVFVSRRYAGKNKVYAGVGGAYYSSVYNFLRNNEVLVGKEKQNSWEGSVFVGNEFLIGRFGLVLEVGVPFKRTYLAEDFDIEKLGYKYYILQREKGPVKELTIHTFIKAVNLEASVIEFGTGIGI